MINEACEPVGEPHSQAGILGFRFGPEAVFFLGGLFYFLRNFFSTLGDILLPFFVASLEINDTESEEIYWWLEEWLVAQDFASGTNRMKAKLQHAAPMQQKTGKSAVDNRKQKSVLYLPGTGVHLFWYMGSLIWISLHKDNQPKAQGNGRRGIVAIQGTQVSSNLLQLQESNWKLY